MYRSGTSTVQRLVTAGPNNDDDDDDDYDDYTIIWIMFKYNMEKQIQ